MIRPLILKVCLCEWETSGTNSTVSYSIEQKNYEKKQMDEQKKKKLSNIKMDIKR
jgi:hypothetical protein